MTRAGGRGAGRRAVRGGTGAAGLADGVTRRDFGGNGRVDRNLNRACQMSARRKSAAASDSTCAARSTTGAMLMNP